MEKLNIKLICVKLTLPVLHILQLLQLTVETQVGVINGKITALELSTTQYLDKYTLFTTRPTWLLAQVIRSI